ncbi:MAG: molybdenum cofactor guanylyltransferase [Syntrophaceticus sp.]|nr:molybdenum cofactor guanylyltransferase [Syntrophaceticus sp.]MDD4782926.1 molybdenum cofactor guanylyltransferase [Syntrophaceticus sp.]
MLATGIILAGGKSSRFKSNKAMVKISSQRLIDRIIDVLAEVFYEIILVTNTPDQYNALGIRTVTDIIPGKGPLSGMHAGLICSSHDLNFVTACDLPFINKDILRYLLDQTGICDDAVVPIVEGYPEPLAAVYRKTCIKPIEDALINNQYKVKSFYPHIRLKYIAERELQQFGGPMSFFNINTQDDLRIALEQLKEKQ